MYKRQLEVRKNNEDGYEGTDNLKKQNTGSDPAYEKYRQTSEFYRTHGYLAWIGKDEADFDMDEAGGVSSLTAGTGENVSSNEENEMCIRDRGKKSKGIGLAGNPAFFCV